MSDLTSLYQKQPLRDIGIQSSVNALLDLVNQYPDYFISGKFTDFFNTLGGTQPPKKDFIDHPEEGYVRFLQIRDFSSESTPTFIPISKNNKICSEDDIIIGRYGASVGKILTGKSGAYNVACAKIEPLIKINNKFLFYWLHNSKFQNQLRGISRSAQGGFNKNDLARFDVVVLKYEYQSKIVEILEKIDEYLIEKKDIGLCLDSLEPFYKDFFQKAKIFLDSIHYIDNLKHESIFQQETLLLFKQAILQEAISGKLTAEWRKQNPMQKGDPDTDAVALLDKIKAEKQQLITDGKLKKEKPLPPISSDEVPFSLPDGWVWCRLGDIIKENPRNGYSPKTVSYQTSIKTLKLGATTWGKFNPNEYKYIDEEIQPDSIFWLKKNDILIQRSNSIDYVGVSAIYDGEDNEFIYPDLMIKVQMMQYLYVEFSYLVLSSPMTRTYFRNLAKGAQKSMPKITQSVVLNTLFPLTPLAEQKAIVEKVDYLMKQIEELEAQIKHRKQLAEELMQTVLREAFV
jgi:type I restriction enzyme S subunit